MALKQVIGTNSGNIYAITASGALLWYKDLKQDGNNGSCGETGWQLNSGSQVGFGWESFKHVFAGGNGIIYAIKPTGELLWYQDLLQDGTNGSLAERGWHPNSGSQIGFGWGNFRHVFADGNGIIYAITATGELLWYQDLLQDGTNGSSGERGWHMNSGSQIGFGWENFKHVFAGGNGIIYAITPIGKLLWYQDLLQDGTNGSSAERGWNVISGKTIGTGWYSVPAGIFFWGATE